MARNDLDYAIISAMLLTGLYVAVSGLVMDLFGLQRFAFHNYVGYAWATLAMLHLVLNGRRVTTYLRHRLRVPPGKEPPGRIWDAASPERRRLLVSALAAAGGFIVGRLIPGPRLQQLSEKTIVKLAQDDLGTCYHQWSKAGYSFSGRALADWGERPQPYKTYPTAQQISLPDPHGYQGLSLEEAIERRRSIRDYTAGPLSLEDLSRLLHAGQGITDQHRSFRAAPSAGALYPIETYVVVHDVSGLEPGLYHYAITGHALEQLRTDNLRTQLLLAGIGQDMLAQAQVCLVLAAMFQRTRWRYHERTYRYVLLEAGHIGQNLYMAATSMGLGACAVGAFLDDQLNDLLGLDGVQEAALYLISLGRL
jgi:SagB-type dehydrogenase family enzyme